MPFGKIISINPLTNQTQRPLPAVLRLTADAVSAIRLDYYAAIQSRNKQTALLQSIRGAAVYKKRRGMIAQFHCLARLKRQRKASAAA
jgi:hypothetical protein